MSLVQPAPAPGPGQRLDKWLWFARFFKSRTLAAKLLNAGRVRVNKRVVSKASQVCRVGDILTFPQARQIRVIRVLDLGTRRGPASEAVALYEDLTPETQSTIQQDGAAARQATQTGAKDAARQPGTGRPTKRQRRQMDRWLESPNR